MPCSPRSTQIGCIDVNASDIAWLTLRAVYAWMFLYPAIGLLKDWPTTVQTTALLFKWHANLFAAGSMALMIGGAVMILVGLYGSLAGAGLCLFCLGGARVHYKLGAMAGATKLSSTASKEDVEAAARAASLAVVGHVTSAEKNFVLAAVGFFFFLMGTGPWSLVDFQPFS